jgi:serine/threonine-protein kinase
VFVEEVQTSANNDLMALPLESDVRVARPLVASMFNEWNGEVSPDGRWLAYQSNESGRYEIYVRPFPNVEAGRWQVSTAGGTRPLWSRDGRELFYFVSPGKVMAVSIQRGPTFAAGNPQVLFEGRYAAPQVGRVYDVSPDGRRFLMLKESESGAEAQPPQLVVVLNWFEELKRLVPNP